MGTNRTISFRGLRVSNKSIDRRIKNLTDNDTWEKIYTRIESGRPKTQGLRTYVPQDTGNLIESAYVSAKGIKWTTPYVRYLYHGEIMGPNYLVKDKKTGGYKFRTPHEMIKYRTGRPINFNRSISKNAQKFWDKRFLQQQMPWVNKNVEQILRKRARKLNLRFK